MTTAYRLHRPGQSPFDTIGSRLAEGRWHSRFTEVVYAAEHASLAVLETLVHAGGRRIPPRSLSRIHIPSQDLIEIAGWLPFPASQVFGDTWVRERRTPLLSVPSAPMQQLERNLVVNPAHPDFARISANPAIPFTFDPRLFSL